MDCFFADNDKIVRTFNVSEDVIQRRSARGLATERTLEFEFTDIPALLVELLLKFSGDKKNYLYEYAPMHRPTRKRQYGELQSGTRYRDALHLSGADRAEAKYRLCPILLWTDSCSPDFKRQAKLKPIALTCGNLIGAIARSVAGKRLVGFWPSGPKVAIATVRAGVFWILLHSSVCSSARTPEPTRFARTTVFSAGCWSKSSTM
jgi:hypothetical protein